MKFWLFLSYEPPETLIEHARRAEERGFEGVALSDHIAIPASDMTDHPNKYPVEPDDIFTDQVVGFASMAAVTSRLKFLSYIYVVPARNPLIVAKQFGSLAVVSNDRVILGSGVGWMPEEFAAVGQEFDHRGTRTDEMFAIMKDFWDDGYAEFHGKHYDIPRMGMAPVPRQQVPIWIGGQTPVAFRRAAQHDGFIVMRNIDQLDRLNDDIRADFRAVDQQRAELGLTGPFRRCVKLHRSVTTWDAGAARRLEEVEGITDLVIWPWPDARMPLEEKWRAVDRFVEQVMQRY